VGLLACRLLNLSWSVTLHGTADLDYPSRLLIPKKVEAARFIVCVSDYGRAQALRIVQPPLWNKFRVVRCGVSLSAFPERIPHTGRMRIVSVGRLSPEKGQLGLLEAFSGLVKRGLDVELRIIGDGPLHAELQNRLQADGLADRCVLVGRRSEPEVAVELASADVFALSSFMEGLPVALMEALAMRLGVIAPSVAGIPELVEHERTGLLFTAGRWDQLEEGLARLISDPALRSRLGEAGRARVQAEFEIDTAVEPLFQEFKKLDKEGNS
jgi:glycosyltransferase involved in cell wall biosynthesis